MTTQQNRVIFTPPDYDSPRVLDELLRALTGQSLAGFAHELYVNPGKYEIYEEEQHAAE